MMGNLPVTLLVGLVVLAPLYGGGALLIREVVRRTGRGWPSILPLGLAYGIFEEGVTTQSLFNRNYVGAHLLDVGYVPALGIAIPWTLAVLALHTVWSISAPIGLVEAMVPRFRTTPWLGKVGLTVTGTLFVLGSVATTAMQLAGGFALVCGSAYRLTPDHTAALVPVVVMLAVAGVAVTTVTYWSRRPGWAPRHQLALVAGAILAYGLHAFIETPVLPVSATVDHVGDVFFGVVAALAIAVTARRTRQASIEPAAMATETTSNVGLVDSRTHPQHLTS